MDLRALKTNRVLRELLQMIIGQNTPTWLAHLEPFPATDRPAFAEKRSPFPFVWVNRRPDSSAQPPRGQLFAKQEERKENMALAARTRAAEREDEEEEEKP